MNDTEFSVEHHDVKGLGAPLSDYTSIVGVRGGRVLFVSGKGPADAHGNTVSNDIETQIRQAMTNMESALAASGAALENVVKVNAYFTRKECFPIWRGVRREKFPRNFPASTAVLVPGLAIDDWMVEIEAYAVTA